MSQQTRPIRSGQELRAAAVHIQYEVHTMLTAASFIGTSMTSPSTEETSNVALESFLIHFRNLRDFVCPDVKKIKEDDIISSDYFKSKIPMCNGDVKKLHADKTRINKLLAHLSYERASLEIRGEKEWHIDMMISALEEGFRAIFMNPRLEPDAREWLLPALQEFETPPPGVHSKNTDPDPNGPPAGLTGSRKTWPSLGDR